MLVWQSYDMMYSETQRYAATGLKVIVRPWKIHRGHGVCPLREEPGDANWFDSSEAAWVWRLSREKK